MPRTMITRIRKTGPPDRPWCLLWQSAQMPAPAFWYYRTKREANSERAALIRSRMLDRKAG